MAKPKAQAETEKPAPAFVSLGWSAISWIEHYLVHGPGDIQGQRISVDDEFAAFVVRAYELKPNGDRRVRRAFLSRAKGRAKSEVAAFIECFEALGPCRFDHWAEPGEVSDWGYEYEPGEPVGKPLRYVEILNVATEEDQAGNTYDVVYYNLNPETCSPELLEDYGRLDVGLSRINLPNQRGSIEPVTSADSSKDGGKSTFIVADETHLWILRRLRSLHRTMARNLLKRKVASGWMLETSTMYGEGEGSVAEGTHAYALAVKSGRQRDNSLLFDHKQASSKWDLTDRKQRIKALRESYGPASAWMDLEAIADSWDDPEVTEAEFKRYWLNQPVPMDEKPSSILPKWRACGSPERGLDGTPIIAIATSFDRAWSSISGAVVTNDGTVVGKLLSRGPGTSWVVEHLRTLAHGGDVHVDPKGPAGTLIPALEAAGIPVREVDAEFVCDSASEVLDRTEAGTLEHFNQPELDAAVEVAAWRTVNDRRAFGRRVSGGDISPLESLSFAALAASRELVGSSGFNIW